VSRKALALYENTLAYIAFFGLVWVFTIFLELPSAEMNFAETYGKEFFSPDLAKPLLVLLLRQKAAARYVCGRLIPARRCRRPSPTASTTSHLGVAQSSLDAGAESDFGVTREQKLSA
jgi:hypothetical protein